MSACLWPWRPWLEGLRAWVHQAGSHLRKGASAAHPGGCWEGHRVTGLACGACTGRCLVQAAREECGRKEKASFAALKRAARWFCYENRGRMTSYSAKGPWDAVCDPVPLSGHLGHRSWFVVNQKCSELDFSINHSSCREKPGSRASEMSALQLCFHHYRASKTCRPG